MDIHDRPASWSSWRNSEHICALADSERHFGHVIKIDQWHAYDATHADEAMGGVKYLGTFGDLAAAMQAVESSVARVYEPKTTQAAG